MRPPVFIFGMHRSGTTLLVKLLHELGLFAGNNWDPNAEPWYLLRRNEWILRRAGGAWDRPTPALDFLQQPTIRRALVAIYHNCVRNGEQLEIPELRDELGTSRKFLIPLLEYIDGLGMTQLRGGVRRLLQTSPVCQQIADAAGGTE